MKREKRIKNRVGSFLLVLCLVTATVFSPIGKYTVKAQGISGDLSQIVPEQSARLVYGNEQLPDEDAFILLIMGDGFTKDEQDKFFVESKKTADYIMSVSPWNEFSDVVKIYALGVVSNESGAKADKANNQEEANQDKRDTYFQSEFWTGGMQRLLAISDEGYKRAEELRKEYLPAADFNVVMVNSTTYGGSGGETCVASLNNESLEMMLHELGHTTAGLADEYFAGESYAREYANMTAESDPEKVKWSRFIGKNGVGVYEYDNGGDGWYRPHQNCKMRFLGKQYEFCEVCKEELRKSFCSHSNVTKIFFQTYADMFYEKEQGKDMKEYFILRKGPKEITGDQLGDLLQLTYKDSNGKVIDGIPNKAGSYTIDAKFAGNSEFDACEMTAEYMIELPDLIQMSAESKVYDGNPSEIKYTVDYDKEYVVKMHYTGIIPYGAEITYNYDSDEAPFKPGRYNVQMYVYDKETEELISKKSAAYEISFKSTTLSDHNDGAYPGAQPYYNNKTIVFTGEGFTAQEQDKFEKIAKKYVEYFRNAEPYKEADTYFNYHTVEAVSDESGIGTEAKNTYFKVTYDKDGKVVPTYESTEGAKYLGNNVVTSYYKATVVIVNDDHVKQGSVVKDKRFTIYTSSDEKGMEYAANELLNYFTGQQEGYRASTDEEQESQRVEFLKSLYYTWYGWDYAPVLSRAYNEKFVENGKPIDLSPYFHTYILGKEVKEGISYQMSYYENNDGEIGKQLEQIPSEPGKYFAKAELDLKGNQDTLPVEFEGQTYHLPLARGWTEYTILAAEKPEDPKDPVNPEKPEDPKDPVKPEKPKDPVDPSSPEKPNIPNDNKDSSDVKTGDESPIALYVTIIMMSTLVIGVIVIQKRRFFRK